MAAANSRKSNGSVCSSSAAFRRSISPTGGRCSSPSSSASAFASSSASAFASSSASSFSSRSPSFFHRSTSPTRVNFVGSAPPTSSVRFSIDRSLGFASPRKRHNPQRRPIPAAPAGGQRKTCMCSPTTHPGSFRCNLHKGFAAHGGGGHLHHHSVSSPSNRLNARRSAMTNSLVRISTVEGEWVRRALAALIRPSSHQQRRRAAFQPRPSRLSIMSKADDL